MIYWVIIKVCSIAVPGNCLTYEKPIAALMPQQVFMEAQLTVIRTVNEHPGFKLDRWRVEKGQGT